MYSRMVDTKEQADREIVERTAAGKRCTQPVEITYNGRKIWQYSCEV